MTSQALAIFQTLISSFWKFFNGWYFPGTNVTPAGMMFLVCLVPIVLRFLRRVTFIHISDGEKDGK